MNSIRVFLQGSSKKIGDLCQNVFFCWVCTYTSAHCRAVQTLHVIAFSLSLLSLHTASHVFLDNTHVCIFFLTVLTSRLERAVWK